MLPGFPVPGWTKEGLECKNHGDMGGGGVGEGTLVEGMPCSFLSSIEVFRNCQGGWFRWTLMQPRLEITLLHSIGAHLTASFWSLWC